MPPKVDVKTLIGKMENAVRSLCELIEEFETVYSVKPELERLESVFNQVEPKYRLVKKQQEAVFDRLVEEGYAAEDEQVLTIRKLSDKVKADYLQIALIYAAYQTEHSPKKTPDNTETLDAMTSAVQKMAETMSSKPNTSGLERLSVPSWDGTRRTYPTWKREFNHWMSKYSQDKDEQLQRFRKAMPKASFWTEQVKTCKNIDRAWEVLDVEFANKRKLMDELLAEIISLKPIKRDTKSLTRCATTISGYVNDMEDNDCSVSDASEAPFFMSQLLSKLDARDNANFGREMLRAGKEENVSNLISWLHQEASLRSRGKRDDTDNDDREPKLRGVSPRKTDNHAASGEASKQDRCPLGCSTRHLLPACQLYQNSTVNERWQIVKLNGRCRKCLRLHHTYDCSKPDGTTCDKCERNHHRSLHNEPTNSSLSPNAVPFRSQSQDVLTTAESNSIQENATHQKRECKRTTGLCPVQKVKVMDVNGNFIEILAMLDSGSNTSLLSKNAAKRLELTGSATHLTMNLAGGEKKCEVSEVIEITIASPTEEYIKKTLQVYTIKRPCSGAKTISRESIECYPHLKKVSEKLHLSGGAIDLLIGTDFVDAFVDVHTVSGEPGEPIAKRNCFGWYMIGQFDSNTESRSGIQSVEVGTVSIAEDIRKLVHQDLLGVKPTDLCTCSENVLRENKFIESISDSTSFVDGRIQVKMPWNECGPPKHSNHDIALKRMYAAEKSFQKKDCFNVVDEEVQKLLDQNFVINIPNEQVDHSQPEWYLPLQAVFTPERSTKVRLVFDSSSKDPAILNERKTEKPSKHQTASADIHSSSASSAQDETQENPILDHLLKTCSTFPKIQRSLAYVRRFVQNARKKNIKSGPISVQELKDSENQLLKWSQLRLDVSNVDKKLIAKMDQNGLLRAHGRLEDVRSLPKEMRNPVLLPRDHQLVNLLLRHLHEKRGHCAYKSLIHEARKRFWIIRLCDMSKVLTSKCVICRKLRKKPLDQLMGQIPSLNGVVETLIKSVRQGLNSTCKNQAFTEEQWRPFLSEMTYMIIGRPLYPSSDNVWESPPITPNDILIGQHIPPPQPELPRDPN